jgi:hypothetical protein
VEDDVDDDNKDPVLDRRRMERRSWRKWIKESRKPRGQPPKSTGRP